MVPSKHKQSFFIGRWCGRGHIARLGGRWLLGGCGPPGGRLRGLHSMAWLRRDVRWWGRLRGGGVRIVLLLLLKVDWFVHYSIATHDCLWCCVPAWFGGRSRFIWLGGHLGGSFGGHAWTPMWGRFSCVITGPHTINAEVRGSLSLISVRSKEVRRVIKLSSQLLFLLLLLVLLTHFVKMFLQPQTNQFTGTFLERDREGEREREKSLFTYKF